MEGARTTSYFTLALFLFLLMINSQLIRGVNCRTLRDQSPKNTVVAAASEDQRGAVNVRKTPSSVKNMAFIMVAGPSRKGPGH